MKIGITGASGQIGWHLRCHLAAHKEEEVCLAGRETFSDSGALDRFVSGLDVLIHLAGVNRGPENEVEQVNRELADRLIAALNRTGARPHLVFSSAISQAHHAAYGRAKRYCSEQFSAWSQHSGAGFANVILPHVFGEHGRPFYNSVVHTFCHQLAHNDSPVIEQDNTLHLVHAQAVAAELLRAGRERVTGDLEIAGTSVKVSELLHLLGRLAGEYEQNIIPDLRDPLTLALFNTYRSYLYPKHFPLDLKRHSDERGDLFELVKELNGGQVYVSTTKPGITRGNHFHSRKFERFIVLQGKANIRLRRMFSDEVLEFIVDGDQPQVLDIPTLHAHNLTNIGQGELLTLFWSHEIFDPITPDTIRAEV